MQCFCESIKSLLPFFSGYSVADQLHCREHITLGLQLGENGMLEVANGGVHSEVLLETRDSPNRFQLCTTDEQHEEFTVVQGQI